MSLIIGTGITIGTGIAVGDMPLHPVPEYFVSSPFEGFEWTQLNGQLRFYSIYDTGPIANGVSSGDIVVGTQVQIDVYPSATFTTFGAITSIDLSNPGNAIIYVSPPVAVSSGFKSMTTGIKFINS